MLCITGKGDKKEGKKLDKKDGECCVDGACTG